MSTFLLVYLVLGQQSEHIGLLASLQNKGLLQTGDYYVIGIDLEQYDPHNAGKYLRGVLQDNQEQHIVDAFDSYMAVVPSAPIEFEKFASKVRISKYSNTFRNVLICVKDKYYIMHYVLFLSCKIDFCVVFVFDFVENLDEK